MPLFDKRAARILLTVLAFALVLGFFYVTRRTLIAFLFAILFAYLVDPAICRLERVVGRGAAIAITYALLIGLVAVLFTFVGTNIGHQAQRLSESLPGLIEKIGSGQIAEQLGAQHGWSLHTRDQVKDFLVSHREDLLGLLQRVGLRLADVAKESWLLIVVPILAVFFLKDAGRFRNALLSFMQTRAQHEFVDNVLHDLNRMLAHFIRAQLTVAALSLVVYTAFLSIARVPYALVLGTAGGIMEFVPVVGPAVAALVILEVAVLSSYPHWLVLLIFLAAWRMVQDYVISPRILGKSIEMHPLVALFGVLAGGEIAGVLGVYLSIPVMATLRIVWRQWQAYSAKRQMTPLTDTETQPLGGRRL
ncbi:MAG: AI-2E family transporter [Acidobacteriales bacterium]|nr:AI-2E family transporter [Terriglobales bacterium]